MTDQSGYDLFCKAANAVAKIDLLGGPGTSYCTAAEVHAMGVILKAMNVLPHVPARSHNTGDRLDVYLRDVTQIFPDPGYDPLKALTKEGPPQLNRWGVSALQMLLKVADNMAEGEFVADDFEDVVGEARHALENLDPQNGENQ